MIPDPLIDLANKVDRTTLLDVANHKAEAMGAGIVTCNEPSDTIVDILPWVTTMGT